MKETITWLISGCFELLMKYPDRFVATVVYLSMNDRGGSLKGNR